jgi:hypothetical protein
MITQHCCARSRDVSDTGREGKTYTIGQPDDLVTQLPLFPILTFVSSLFALFATAVELDNLPSELYAHDRLAGLRRERVLALPLHDIHTVQAEGFYLFSRVEL